MWHDILNFFGVINEGGKGYGFWSGVGSDIGEVALIGAVIAAYRRHNCHVRRCWRLQRHPVEGTPWIVCRKHHPTINQLPDAGDLVHRPSSATIAQPGTASPSTVAPTA